MLTHYREQMAFVKEVFGEKFLGSAPDEKLLHENSKLHPLRRHWWLAQRFLRERSILTEYVNPDLAIIDLTADVLKLSRKERYLDEARIQKLKRPDLYNSTFYELKALYYYSDRGIASLVPESDEKGTRRPDLRLDRDGQTVWIECLAKDRLKKSDLSELFLEKAGDRLNRLMGSMPVNHRLELVTIGVSESAVTDLINMALELITKGQMGHYLHPAGGHLLSYVEGNSPPPHHTLPPATPEDIELWFNVGHNISGSVEAQFSINSDGIATKIKERRWSLVALDSHSFRAVLNSFNTKRQRGQLPQEGFRVLQFDLDLTQVPWSQRRTYLKSVSCLLQQRVWSGRQNTSIDGIVLTASPAFIEAANDQCSFLSSVNLRWVIPAHPGALPDWFLPKAGESLTLPE